MENDQPRFITDKAQDLLTLVQAAVDQKKTDKDAHWTIKVFGGAIFSVFAVLLIGAFQSAFNGVNDCQKCIQAITATSLTKDEYNLRTKAFWDALKDCETQKADIAAVKERNKMLEQELRDLRGELQKLRDKFIVPQPPPHIQGE